MSGAIYGGPDEWEGRLPTGTRRLRRRSEIGARRWDVFALAPDGCRTFAGAALSCGLLLCPGDYPIAGRACLRVRRAASYGMSPRDTLTFSSLQEPVLCVQRALPRPDGLIIEPQEIPLPWLPTPAEQYLPLLGLWLACGDGIRVLQFP